MTREWPDNSRIRFSIEQIPELNEPLPVVRLGPQAVAPEALTRECARAVARGAELTEHGKSGLRAAYDGHRLVAYVHPATGQSRVYPSLEKLRPGEHLAQRAAAAAERIVRDRALFPEDMTEVIALPPVTLFGAKHSKTDTRTEPAEYLSFVRFERRLNGLPVFGPGSSAMIGVEAGGSIPAFFHRWRQATETSGKIAAHPRHVIANAIVEQLTPSAKVNHVHVDKVTVGYYDSGQDVLQPVYRFEATVKSPDAKTVANRHVLGYVSIGDAPELLPVLGVQQGKSPSEPPTRRQRPKTSGVAPAGDPKVGRYVVRDDSPDWVNSANDFMASLEAAQGLFGVIQFTDSQYYWAEPWEFLADKNAFVNDVQIALNEVHGNWGLFSTRDNHDDIVRLSTVPAGGYGSAGGGALAFWILHSCEVIPTQTDEATSFNIWWNLFDGLHAAVGYRTDMWIADGVTGPFGFAIGLGAPVVPAWISEVVGNSSYNPDATYHDGNRDMTEPMGRPSAIAVCGHTDDTAADVGPLPAATCLTEWWIGN
jgi:Family of unknown function (DUF6345)